jgi:hypothetical protein
MMPYEYRRKERKSRQFKTLKVATWNNHRAVGYSIYHWNIIITAITGV